MSIDVHLKPFNYHTTELFFDGYLYRFRYCENSDTKTNRNHKITPPHSKRYFWYQKGIELKV